MKLLDGIRLIIAKLRKRRSKELCSKCPDEIRGTCCYFGVHLQEPDEFYCADHCTEYLRNKCTFPKDRIKPRNTGEKWNVILPNHPCKYLDINTKLCTIYPDRLIRNRLCRTIKQGIPTGIWHPDCIYVRKNKKYRAGLHKVWYEEIKENLCDLGKINFELCNDTPHRVLIKY